MKEKPSQIEKIKAILEVMHELPVDEEADQRVSEFLKPRGAEFDNIDTKECTNCDKLSAAWNTEKKAWVCRECAWVQYPSNAQGYLAEQVIESCDSPEEDKAWEYLDNMHVLEIRNAVLEKLNENAEEFKGWEINCSLDTFEFGDDEYMDNYLMYRISHHEKEISFRFHHQIHNGQHHCWWYNFDNIFETYSDKIAVYEMVSFISNQIRGVK